MTDTNRRAADIVTAYLVNRALMAFAALLIVWATVEVSHIKPWGFARPPAEACRQGPATPQTQHLPQCPRKATT